MKRLPRNSIKRAGLRRLVRTALRHWDTDHAWLAILEMQTRGSADTLLAATTLATRVNWRHRGLGLYIASQLGRGHTAYALPETQQLLLRGLHDSRDEVMRAAVSGLGHRPHPDALPRLVELSLHESALLRWDVAISLGRYEAPSAIVALLRLMTDPDDMVRDWATFALGSQHAADSAEIRAALWKNLDDADEGVRGEAMVGLAERRDERVPHYLKTRLGPDCRVYELEAAERIADPALLPELQALFKETAEADPYWRSCLHAAIITCQAASGSAQNA